MKVNTFIELVAIGAFCAGVVLCSGCNTTKATYTDKAGNSWSVENERAAWATDAYDWGIDPTNGWFYARASKSSPDAATVAAFANLFQTIAAMHP